MNITNCKLKKSIQNKLLEFFVLEVTARARLIYSVSKPIQRFFYRKISEVISYHLALETDEVVDGQIELDESYFGGHRKGKRGRGAAGKVAVFGLLKRQGKVFTVVVENTRTETLMPVIVRKIKPDSWVYTDTYRSYDALDVSKFHHERINHSELFAVKQNHINGIENFWSQTKRILRKYNGIDRKNFPLFLKECEFRFNFGSPKEQLKTW